MAAFVYLLYSLRISPSWVVLTMSLRPNGAAKPRAKPCKALAAIKISILFDNVSITEAKSDRNNAIIIASFVPCLLAKAPQKNCDIPKQDKDNAMEIFIKDDEVFKDCINIGEIATGAFSSNHARKETDIIIRVLYF